MPMSDTDIVERLRWQKRYTNGIVPVTMEDAAKQIERLRATLLNIQALAERGDPIDTTKLAEQCRHGLGQTVPETPKNRI